MNGGGAAASSAVGGGLTAGATRRSGSARGRVAAAAVGTAGASLAGLLLALHAGGAPVVQARAAPAAPPTAAAPADGRAGIADGFATAASPRQERAATAPSAAPPRRLAIRASGAGGGLLDVEAIGVDRRQAIAALADATGTSLHGVELLPPSLGRVSVRANGVDRGTAWQRVLDGAAVGYALACERRSVSSCAVWFAPAAVAAPDHPTPPAATAATLVLAPRVESSEGEN